MGTPNKTSSLFVLNGLDVYTSLYGSLAIHQVHALCKRFLPATSSFFVPLSLFQTFLLNHLLVDASCNYYGCFILWNYVAFGCVLACLISASIFNKFPLYLNLFIQLPQKRFKISLIPQ